jgi:O-antigen biosynthesis protein
MQNAKKYRIEINKDTKPAKSTPTVSIGLTVFNAEKYLKKTMESLLGQSFQDFELIISDNASIDKSSDICREYEEKDSRIRYVRNQINLGSVQNITNVFQLSSGKYFMWASDHDLWDSDALTSYIDAFSTNKSAVLIYSPSTIIDETDKVIRVDHAVQDKKGNRTYQTFLDTITGRIGPNAFCGLFKAEVLKQASLARCFGFDTILLAELSLKGNFVELGKSYFCLRQNRPVETLHDQVGRYINMLFEKKPNEYVISMPYEHMIYRYLCMIQNNNLSIDEQIILNQYVLHTFTKLWRIKQNNIAYVIREIEKNPGLESLPCQSYNAFGARKFKKQNDVLDINIFSGTIKNTTFSQLAAELITNTEASVNKNSISKKFITDKRYDVCYILYNTDKWGGVKSALSHINGLVDRGYRVCLVAKSGPPAWYRLKSDFIHSPALSLQDIPEADIIVGTWYPTIPPVYQSKKGIPVHYCQGYEGQSTETPDSQKDLIRDIYQLPTIKIVNAPHVANLLKEKLGYNAYIVHNDIDHEVFYPQNNAKDGGCKNILIVGPFEVMAKGIRVCLAACDIIRKEYNPDINIIRVSQTPKTPEEENMCNHLGEHYTYNHNLSENEMASLYNSCDILLAGSYPAGDSFGLPAMEALSCGLPVVLTDIPAHRDFNKKHDFAMFVPAGDSTAMAKAASQVLTNQELRDNLVTRGLEVSAQYNITRTIDELEAALKDILDKCPIKNKGTQTPVAGYYSFARPEIQQMVNTTSQKILDIGCASGTLGSELKRDLGAEVWGIELVPEVAEKASHLLDKVIMSGIEDAIDQIPDGYFDTVILADVLEHLRDPLDVLCNLKKKLSSPGEVIASIPNVRHWSVLKELLEGRWNYTDAGILDRTHLRFFTKKTIIDLFQKAGLAIQEMGATRIQGQTIPKEIISALSKAKIDTSTLEEESTDYQYLVKAVIRESAKNIVSIIILTFNQLEYTKKCVKSLRRHTPEPHEIIFVDNGSTDSTVQWLKTQMRENKNYKLIENKQNLGFAKGCNQGIELSEGEFILLLNNDVVVADGWLSGLMSCLNHAPDAGIVGPMTNSISSPQQIHDDSYRSVGDLDKYAAKFKERFHHRRIPLNRIVGFCMLFKRTLFEQIGGLDESFGTGNFEDDDFCLRVTLAGYSNYAAGDVFIHHFGSRSFIGSKIDYGASISGNRKILENKWRTSILSPQGKRMAVLQVQDMAHVIYSKGKTDQAIEALINCIKLAPDAKEIYYELALILFESERFSEAWEVMESMPETAKNELKGLELAGCIKEGLGLDDEAAFYVDKMLALDGKYPAALNLRGVLAYKQDAKEKAADDFQQAINADPGHGEAYTNLGVLCWGLDKKEEALAHLKRGFVLSPTIPDVSSLYYSVVSSLGTFSDAEADFREACRLCSNNKSLAFLLIDILIRQGNFDSAMVLIEDALSIFGLDEGTLNAALAVREKLGPLQIEKASKKGTLSLCMIVKNEEKHLVKCLKSIRDIVDEIIIVDTGSTDKTKDIATVFGAKVFDFPWTGDFAAARNHSLEQATGNWILVLDADEVISSPDFKKLKEIIHRKSASPVAYAIATRNYARSATIIGWTQNKGDYPEEAGPGWFISTKVRLFTKHKNIFFSNPVHELVESSLQKAKIPIASCRIVVHHYGKLDEQKDLQKGEDYYLLGKIKYENDPTNLKYVLELARQAFGLNKCEEAVDLWLKLLSLFLKADPNSPAYKELLDVTYGDPLSEIYNQLAAVYLTLDRYEEALAAARKAMECKTKLKESVYTYVHCEIIAGSLDKAFCELDDLLKTMPDYPPAMLLMSVILCLEGKKDKAQEYFRLLQQDQVYLPPLLNNFARQLRNQGRIDGALLILNMAIQSKISNDETKNFFETLQKSKAGFMDYTPQGRLEVPQSG